VEVEITGDVNKYKRRELLSCHVVIIWVEDILDYSKEIFTPTTDQPQIYFIIQPLQCGLYRVHAPIEVTKAIGSLIEYIVLSKHMLGTFVRRCVQIAHCWTATSFENGFWKEPNFLQRSKIIQNTLRAFSRDVPLKDIYCNHFTKFSLNPQQSLETRIEILPIKNLGGNSAVKEDTPSPESPHEKLDKKSKRESKKDKNKTASSTRPKALSVSSPFKKEKDEIETVETGLTLDKSGDSNEKEKKIREPLKREPSRKDKGLSLIFSKKSKEGEEKPTSAPTKHTTKRKTSSTPRKEKEGQKSKKEKSKSIHENPNLLQSVGTSTIVAAISTQVGVVPQTKTDKKEKKGGLAVKLRRMKGKKET